MAFETATISDSRLSTPSQKLSLLGRGAFGEVHAGTLDEVHPVAIKRLHARPQHSHTLPLTRESARQRASRHVALAKRQFRREVRRYAALSGIKGVPRFYGVVSEKGVPAHAFVMDRMFGGSLRQASGEEVCEEAVVALLRGIAVTIAEIHRRGFAHGDVKPGNILLAREVDLRDATCVDGIETRLVDFGLCNRFDEADEKGEEEEFDSCEFEAVSDPGVGGAVLGGFEARGTPAYLSPEAWCGPKALRRRAVAQMADVYALGIVMYQLETGLTPWEGLSEWSVFVNVCNRAMRPKWPNSKERVAGIRTLAEMCWRHDFRDRPSCACIADALSGEGALLLPAPPAWQDNALYDTCRQPHHSGEHHSEEHHSEEPPLFHKNYAASPVGGEARDTTDMSAAPVAASRCAEHELRQVVHDYLVTTAPLPHSATSPTDLSSSVMSPVHAQSAEPLSPVVTARVPSKEAFSPASVGREHDAEYLLDPSDRVRTNDDMYLVPRVVDSSHPHAVHSAHVTPSSSQPEMPVESEGASSLAFAERDGPDSTLVIPESVRRLQYAFKKEIVNDDCLALCNALVENERSPKVATSALEGLAVLLDNSRKNCSIAASNHVIDTISSILSRYGRNDSRLCKSACVVVLRMAISSLEPVERHLCTSAACEIVLHSMRWHPANLPVMQNGACALNALCRASPALCSIVAELGGASFAVRAIARSAKTFECDIPVASAGLEIIGALVRLHLHCLLSSGVIAAVLACCNAFANERIDAQCITVLYSMCRNAQARDKAILTPSCLNVVSRLIDRIVASPSCATQAATLTYSYCLVAELAKSTRKREAATAFLSSNIVESVLQSMTIVENQDTSGNVSLVMAGLDCLKNMSGLGRDVCGSLQMSDVFEFTASIVHGKADNRAIAFRAVTFLNCILNELRANAYATKLDVVFELLVRMQDKWSNETQLVWQIRSALRVIDECSTMRENGGGGIGNVASSQEEQSQPSSLRLLVQRISHRNRQPVARTAAAS